MPEVSSFSEVLIDLSAAADLSLIPKILYSRKEASWAIGLSLRSLDALVASGQIKTRKMGRRIMVPAAALEKFAQKDCAALNRESLT